MRLWNARLTTTGARAITREAFGHLALLDLSDPGLVELVREVCPEVRTSSPRLRAIVRPEVRD